MYSGEISDKLYQKMQEYKKKFKDNIGLMEIQDDITEEELIETIEKCLKDGKLIKEYGIIINEKNTLS